MAVGLCDVRTTECCVRGETFARLISPLILRQVNMYSLMLVLILRRHVKNTIQRRSECDRPVIFTRDMQVAVDRSLTADDARPEVENAARGRATDLISPEPMATVPFSSFSIRSQIAATASQNAGAVGQNELALRRLASDLSFAVPVTILMCGILISGVGVLVAKQFRFTSWPLYEFVSREECVARSRRAQFRHGLI